MRNQMKLALRFKSEKGEARNASLYLNMSSSPLGVSGTYWSSSAWVGTLFGGAVEEADWWSPSKGVYVKNDTDGLVALVNDMGPWKRLGDTGTGRLYCGCSGRYAVPFDFNWDCIATGADAIKQMTSDKAQAEQETSVGIGPFTTP